PQLPHLALALLAVAGRVGHRVEVRFAGGLDQPRLCALAALGRVQQPLVALVGGNATLDSCHGVRVLLEVRQQAADLLCVDVLHQRLAGVAARPAGRLDLEVVPAPRLDADHLATAGGTDPLLRSLVALDLGHLCLTLLSLPGPVLSMLLSVGAETPWWPLAPGGVPGPGWRREPLPGPGLALSPVPLRRSSRRLEPPQVRRRPLRRRASRPARRAARLLRLARRPSDAFAAPRAPWACAAMRP